MQLTVDKDLENSRLTVTATFDHPVAKVWDLFADPRKLERWWGPPGAPATVTEHALKPGGVVVYFMTIDGGQRHFGRWDVEEVLEPERFVVRDVFADEHGEPVADLPSSTMTFTFDEQDGRTTMRCVGQYPSSEALAQVVAMGIEEGLKGAMSQIEPILAEA